MWVERNCREPHRKIHQIQYSWAKTPHCAEGPQLCPRGPRDLRVTLHGDICWWCAGSGSSDQLPGEEMTQFLLQLQISWRGFFFFSSFFLCKPDVCFTTQTDESNRKTFSESRLGDVAFLKKPKQTHACCRSEHETRGHWMSGPSRSAAPRASRHISPFFLLVSLHLPPPQQRAAYLPRNCESLWPIKGLNVLSMSAFLTLPALPPAE